ncbi:MAG: endonuclease/exonuclease/phosphatase family protein [Rickettsiales bacterium]
MIIIRAIDAWFVAAMLGLACILCFFAHKHWIAELVIHFRLHLAVISLLFLVAFLLKGLMWQSAAILLLACFFIWPVFSIYSSPAVSVGEKKDTLRILQFNISYGNEHFLTRAIPWIIKQDADIVVLQEINAARAADLEALERRYPWSKIEVNIDRSAFGTAIFSRLAVDKYDYIDTGERWNHYAFLELRTNSGLPLSLYTIHPPPPVTPSFAKQRINELELMGRVIEQDPVIHKVLVGDFNSTVFSPHFAALTTNTGLYHAQQGYRFDGTWPTFLPAPLRIGIDHLLASKSIRIEARDVGPDLGSDHAPVVSQLELIN